MLLRLAVPNDALPVARVHVRSWQAAYRNLLPQEYLDGLRPQERAARYDFGVTEPDKPCTLVAVASDEIVGFVTVSPARDPGLLGSGEVCALYVEPEWWGRSVGRALLEHGRARLRGLGFEHAVLWVMAGNTRAERFYSSDGWTHEGGRRTASVWGVTVEEALYRRRLATPS